jgi:hypothetical protein
MSRITSCSNKLSAGITFHRTRIKCGIGGAGSGGGGGCDLMPLQPVFCDIKMVGVGAVPQGGPVDIKSFQLAEYGRGVYTIATQWTDFFSQFDTYNFYCKDIDDYSQNEGAIAYQLSGIQSDSTNPDGCPVFHATARGLEQLTLYELWATGTAGGNEIKETNHITVATSGLA